MFFEQLSRFQSAVTCTTSGVHDNCEVNNTGYYYYPHFTNEKTEPQKAN